MVVIKDFGMPSCCYECDLHNYHNCDLTNDDIEKYLDDGSRHPNCPLVEIEERKHGKWEHDKLFGECAYVCSFCHTIWKSSEIQNMHYCPTCSA